MRMARGHTIAEGSSWKIGGSDNERSRQQSKPFPMIALTLENRTTTVPRYYTNIECRLCLPKYTKEKGQPPALGITYETVKLELTLPKDHVSVKFMEGCYFEFGDGV